MAKSKYVPIRNTNSLTSIPKKVSMSCKLYLIGNYTKNKAYNFFDYFEEYLSFDLMLMKRANNRLY
jgi:hypothetical protein